MSQLSPDLISGFEVSDRFAILIPELGNRRVIAGRGG
jgi:hypothetical protein